MRRMAGIALRGLETLLVLIYILFEELVWEQFVIPVRRMIERVVRPYVERYILALHRYTVLAVFIGVLVMAEGLGIAAGVALVVAGPLVGFTLYGLKVVLAGIAFWILSIAKEKLLRIGWFRRSYEAVLRFKHWVETREVYLRVKRKAVEVKTAVSRWLAARRNGRLQRLYRRLKAILLGKEG
jgi:hypothetical protein